MFYVSILCLVNPTHKVPNVTFSPAWVNYQIRWTAIKHWWNVLLSTVPMPWNFAVTTDVNCSVIWFMKHKKKTQKKLLVACTVYHTCRRWFCYPQSSALFVTLFSYFYLIVEPFFFFFWLRGAANQIGALEYLVYIYVNQLALEAALNLAQSVLMQSLITIHITCSACLLFFKSNMASQGTCIIFNL